MTAQRQQVLATIVTNPQSSAPLQGQANLPTAVFGVPWTGIIGGIYGTAPYGYSVTSKPAWISTSVVGGLLVLQGTPGAAGQIAVTISDFTATSIPVVYYLDVQYPIAGGGGGLGVLPPPQTSFLNQAYSLDLKTYLNNPTLPLTSSVVTTGTLPTGMSIASTTGIISAATVTGSTQFVVVTVTDGAGQIALIPLQLVVAPDLAITTPTLPAAVIGHDYYFKLNITGGSGQYSVAVTGTNSLATVAPGISLNSKTGELTGVATVTSPTTGALALQFTVTDVVTGRTKSTLNAPLSVNTSVPPAPLGYVVTTDLNGNAVAVDMLSAFFGGGSDGNITIDGSANPSVAPLTGGANRMTRTLYAQNLTFGSSGKLNPNGCDIYVSDTLDITNASAKAISGIAVSPSTDIAPGAWGINGGAHGAGGVANGANGTAPTTPDFSFGKKGGKGGDGGHGSGTNVGGTGATPASPGDVFKPIAPFEPRIGIHAGAGVVANSKVGPLHAGGGGAGGGGGGGDGTHAGGDSADGAPGGDRIRIFARRIKRAGTTAAGCIDVSGKDATNGASPSTGTAGGGGGPGGGAGGEAEIYFGELQGSTATNAIKANSGKGGDGGTHVGLSPATDGNGGFSGDGGRIVLGNLLTGQTVVTDGAIGNANSGKTGGAAVIVQASI